VAAESGSRKWQQKWQQQQQHLAAAAVPLHPAE
jgi:hypothetical protein